MFQETTETFETTFPALYLSKQLNLYKTAVPLNCILCLQKVIQLEVSCATSPVHGYALRFNSCYYT